MYHTLLYTGDCGLAIIRHIDSDIAGYMRERQLPRHLRKTDLKIAYLSQQQLRSFNFPYQLGYFTGHNSDPSSSSSITNNDTNTNNNTSSTNTTTNSSSGSMQENKGRFETPSDADTASIPVFPGKIYICDILLYMYVYYVYLCMCIL